MTEPHVYRYLPSANKQKSTLPQSLVTSSIVNTAIGSLL